MDGYISLDLPKRHLSNTSAYLGSCQFAEGTLSHWRVGHLAMRPTRQWGESSLIALPGHVPLFSNYFLSHHTDFFLLTHHPRAQERAVTVHTTQSMQNIWCSKWARSCVVIPSIRYVNKKIMKKLQPQSRCIVYDKLCQEKRKKELSAWSIVVDHL